MKNMIKLLMVLALLTGISVGQTAMTSTTLSSAITATQTIIQVASATGFTASSGSATYIAYVDKEAVKVIGVSGTMITVSRGWDGTRAVGHASSAVIVVGTADQYVHKDMLGSCTAGSEYPNYTPLININSGTRFKCISSLWREVRSGTEASNLIFEGATNDAYTTTITVTDPTADRTWTIPDAASDTFVGRATTDTLTNKTLTSPTINTGTVNTAASVAGGAKFNLATGAAPTTTVAGDMWHDSTTRGVAFAPVAGEEVYASGTVYTLTTPATATNPSAIADLMSYTLPANLLNAAGRVIKVCGGGTYTTAAAQTPTITITYALAGVAPLAIVTAATTASATTMPWQSCSTMTTITAGASGTVEAAGYLMATLGTTAAAAAAVYQGTNTAVSAAFDQTATVAAKIRVTLSSADAGNSVVLRWGTIQVLK